MLTQRQLQLLRYIQKSQAQHGVPPSFEEMRCALKLQSKSGIHRLISGLEERGYIRRLPHRARALEILRLPEDVAAGHREAETLSPDRSPERERPAPETKGRRGRRASTRSNVVWGTFEGMKRRPLLAGGDGHSAIPIYGRIAAGTPIEALAEGAETISVPEMMIGDGQHYVLEVVGDSMIDAGIFNGDFVVIKQGETADSGDIVVALIDDKEVTLKRLRKKGASIALEAANALYETRIFNSSQVKVQGKLVGLLRRYR
ncbi:repressor LexA [Arboricoccus pini]|uniref:LexA repressor n=1 Tax=Arboricoccus pini TaxID=1963835 RepID=A0A212QPI6_9PROT|nr:transcriptional repressor LexA [Arboricoccus pini]SNB61194.1 repressor LexA [Arboricoccus pini]